MIKNSALIILGLFFSIVSIEDIEFTEELLIGKGNPTLYGNGYKLQKEAYDSFILMQKEALKSGIEIKVVSSYRSFEHQKRIWTRKYNQFTSNGMSPEEAISKIIEYSTIPGTSRHHWGTDIDIVDGSVPQPTSVLDPKHFEKRAVFEKFKKWMDENANKYGFYLVYTNESERKGFKYEPWHFSYKPLSTKMLTDYKKIDIIQLFQKEKVEGSEYFTNEFVEKYRAENILDINPVLH